MTKRIEKTCVIGSGTMGAAIAQHLCMKELDVTLVDITDEHLQRGVENIKNSLQEAVDRRILSVEKMQSLISNLKTTTDYSKLAEVDLVIEAVFEDFDVKQKVFSKLEEFVKNDCIIATNTSSFSITELGSKMNFQNRFIGVHYFYHAAKNKLIEIIPGEKTDKKLMQLLVDFYNFNDKSPILVKDVQGFAVNRFFVPWLNEATRLYEEKLASIACIDKIACETFNIGMGPFALMNATGVPIAMHAAITLEDTFGSFYTPSQLLKDQVEKKSNWNLDDDINDGVKNKKIISERLIAASLGVAAQLVSEGVADTTDIDLGAKLGLRWPIGPIEMINQYGISNIKEIISNVFPKYDLPMPELLDSIKNNETIELTFVSSTIINDTGIIEFNRPDSLNALNEITVHQLAAVFDQLDKDSSINKIILTGKGKAFVAGADIKFFVDNINKNDVKHIYDFTEFGQELFKRISLSKKETYCLIDGLTLGGGFELALCTQYRIATPKAVLAFPETGIGIYPGLGGTQRTTRLVGKGLAKFLVATGQMLDAKTALSYGLVDVIIEKPWNHLELINQLSAISTAKKDQEFPEECFKNFDGKITDSLFKNENFKKFEKILRRKAPLALQKSMELIDQGEKLDLDIALKLEMDSLDWVFNTKDALTGLESIIYRKRAEFIGE